VSINDIDNWIARKLNLFFENRIREGASYQLTGTYKICWEASASTNNESKEYREKMHF